MLFLFGWFICQNWKRSSIKSFTHLLCAASLTTRKTLKCSRYICDVCPISGTSTGLPKMVPLIECSTSPISGQNGQNCWLKLYEFASNKITLHVLWWKKEFFFFFFIYIYFLMNQWTFTTETKILNQVEFITII